MSASVRGANDGVGRITVVLLLALLLSQPELALLVLVAIKYYRGYCLAPSVSNEKTHICFNQYHYPGNSIR